MQKLLNSLVVQNFLKSIIFPDAKRPITKDILMRIDLQKAYNLVRLEEAFPKKWEALEVILKKENNNVSNQMTLF